MPPTPKHHADSLWKKPAPTRSTGDVARLTRVSVTTYSLDHIMNTMTPVRPAAPVARYLGGKSKLAKTLIERIDHIPHSFEGQI